MKPTYHHLTLVALCCFAYSAASSQTLGRFVISSAGETVKTQELTLTYVIGEPVAGTFTGDGAFATVGFLQPEIGGVPLRSFSVVQEIIAYPNPIATGNVRLDFKNISSGDYTLDLVNSTGRVVFTQKVNYSAGNSNISLNITPYAGGVYFIRVRGKDFLQGQAKLIKL